MMSKLVAITVLTFTFVPHGAAAGGARGEEVFPQEGRTVARGESGKVSQKRSPAGYKFYVAGNRNFYSNPERAVEHYKTAIAEGYDTVELRMKMGELLRLLERPGEAFEHYRAAIQMDGRGARPHFGLARALMEGGRYEEALEEFEIVKRLQPGDYQLGTYSDYIGKCLDSLGRYDEALKEYEAALRCRCSGETKEDLMKQRIKEIKAILNRSGSAATTAS